MSRFQSNMYPANIIARRALSLGVCALVAATGWLPSTRALAGNQSVSRMQAKPDPEVLLIEVYKALGANQLRTAQLKADALVEAYPNFRLGHLIRGDLLMMHVRPVTALGAAANAPEDKLRNLREEAMVRLKSLR